VFYSFSDSTLIFAIVNSSEPINGKWDRDHITGARGNRPSYGLFNSSTRLRTVESFCFLEGKSVFIDKRLSMLMTRQNALVHIFIVLDHVCALSHYY